MFKSCVNDSRVAQIAITTKKVARCAVLFAMVLVLCACPTTVIPPTITEFKATETTITVGGEVTLSWIVAGTAPTLSVTNVGEVTGKSVVVKPTSTTSYTLTAKNSKGTVEKELTITVNDASTNPNPTNPNPVNPNPVNPNPVNPNPTNPAPNVTKPSIGSFTAEPTTITAGQSSKLSWSVTGTEPVTIEITDVGNPTSTSVSVSPTATKTYTLTASNSAGSVTKDVSITVNPAPPPAPNATKPTIDSFTASPSTITAGQSSTLSWAVSGTQPITISVTDLGTVSGTSGSVSPTATKTYTLTASNSAGSVTKNLSITVNLIKPSITSFTATPASITAGQSSTLSWTVSGTQPITFSITDLGNVTGDSKSVSPNSTKTYTLTASNAAGSVTKDVTITVSPATKTCGDNTREVSSQTLTTQAQVDALSDVNKINGDLIIDPTAAAGSLDLSAMGLITEITGSFDLKNNTVQTEVSGFDCLETIGGDFDIENNIGRPVNVITAISGFEKLSSVNGNLKIVANPDLKSITGFSALSSVGGILFNLNRALSSIPAFTSLSSVDGNFFIRSMPSLASISSFPALSSVGGDFSIRDNSVLTNISGFDSLDSGGIAGTSKVNDNDMLDCQTPNPNFSPVNVSTSNKVNCDSEIKSSFDVADATEGWTISNNELGSEVNHAASGGQSGGYIEGTDNVIAETWYFKAPSQYYGDVSNYSGGTLSFYLLTNPDADLGGLPQTGKAGVILKGNGLVLTYPFSSAPPTTGWTEYSIKLDATDNWQLNFGIDGLATQSDINSALSNLTSLEILGDYYDGLETTDLDSVIMQSP